VSIVARIEQIYNFSVERLTSSQVDCVLANFVSELFWNCYQHNTKIFHQSLLNFLYSLSKMRDKNIDLAFFFSLVVNFRSQAQMVLFLSLRMAFQIVMDRDILAGKVLKVDPICVDLTYEVVIEMLRKVFSTHDVSPELREALDALYESSPAIPYYEVMSCILSSLSDHPLEPALETLSSLHSWHRQSKKREEVEDRRRSESPYKRPASKERQGTEPMLEPVSKAAAKKEHLISKLSPALLRNRDQMTELYTVEGEGELNSRIRREMIRFITKYLMSNLRLVDLLVEEQKGATTDLEGLKLKMNHIIARKCHNLLTALFKLNRETFLQVLMIKDPSPKDSHIIVNLFDIYQELVEKGHSGGQVQELIRSLMKVCVY
jgi:hypothetical protein